MRTMVSSISWVTLVTISSMRVGWMRPSCDQAQHRFAGNLAPDGVEAGEEHGPRSVVNENRDPRGGLEGANISLPHGR